MPDDRHKCFFNGLWHCVRVEPDCSKGFPAHGDSEMGFLLRIAFWFSLVLLLIAVRHLGNEQPGTERVGANPDVPRRRARRSATSAAFASASRKSARSASRRLNTGGVRAREAARIAYEMLDENFGETDKATLTGTIRARRNRSACRQAGTGPLRNPERATPRSICRPPRRLFRDATLRRAYIPVINEHDPGHTRRLRLPRRMGG